MIIIFQQTSTNEIENKDIEEPMVAKNPKDIHSRAERPTGSVHFGDIDFDADIVMDASWGEVLHTCCVHTPKEWGMIFFGFLLILFFLYFFLFGLELLGSSAKVMGGCTAGELFGDETNPIAGLMVGILATVLLQSSSTTTSIVVSLVGSAISVDQGIYMIMGGKKSFCCLSLGVFDSAALRTNLLTLAVTFIKLDSQHWNLSHKHNRRHGTNGRWRSVGTSLCRCHSPRSIQHVLRCYPSSS